MACLGSGKHHAPGSECQETPPNGLCLGAQGRPLQALTAALHLNSIGSLSEFYFVCPLATLMPCPHFKNQNRPQMNFFRCALGCPLALTAALHSKSIRSLGEFHFVCPLATLMACPALQSQTPPPNGHFLGLSGLPLAATSASPAL
eukprot:87200-Pelagomonas_calceolata.AAC.4